MLGLALKSNTEPYHRLVILSQVTKDSDFVVLVTITTAARWPDKSCVLTPADWSELTHDSAVAYATARVSACKRQLEAAIQKGLFSVIASPPAAVLKKMCAAGLSNPETPPIAKKYIAPNP